MHRDVKPDNVMVGENGDVVLTDWGIARDLDSPSFGTTPSADLPSDTIPSAEHSRVASTGAGGIIGTPLYMAPEQAAGAPVDARADIYSAFVVLFELLTLRSYVDAELSLAEILAASTTREPPGVYSPVYSEAPGQPAVPAELRHYLIHGLRNEPEQRFESAAAAVNMLALLRSGQYPIRCPVAFIKSTQGRTLRLMEKWPRTTLMVLSLAAVATLVGGILSTK